MNTIYFLFAILSLIPHEARAGGFIDHVTTNVLGLQLQSSAPATPASGYLSCYGLSSDGKVYCKNSSGTGKAFTYSGAIVNADLSGSAGITNANLATMAQSTFKGRASGAGTGVPVDLTASQAKTALALAFSDISGTAAGSQLPTPGSSTLGGVLSDPCLTHNFVTSITVAGDQTCAQPAFTDLSGTASTSQIAASAVTNAKLADMAAATLKGRASGAGTGAPTDLSSTQAAVIIDAMVGDSGSGGTKGEVPAPGSGDAAAGKFLKADGTWAVAGTGTITVANDAGTGTTVNKLAYINASGNAQIAPAGYSDPVIGIVVSGAGTTGSATIQYAGSATCVFDGTVHQYGGYVVPSTSVAGDCHDAGITYPGSLQNVAIELATRSGAGSASVVLQIGSALNNLNASNITSGTVAAARLPNPSASTIGGVESYASVSHQWINTISTSGVPSSTQPAFSDISGSVAAAQLPNPSASTLGGIESFGLISHNFLVSISTAGAPASAQPAFGDVSGTATVAQMTIGNQALTTCTTARTIDWSTGNQFTILLTNADACAITFSNATSGQAIVIDLTQPASTGSATVTWASSPKWPGGTTPTITTGGNGTDSITCKYNGTDYRCSAVQNFQ